MKPMDKLKILLAGNKKGGKKTPEKPPIKKKINDSREGNKKARV